MNQSDMMYKVGVWLKPRFRKFEIILALLSAISIVLKVLDINGASIILMFSMGLLAILYFFSSHSLLDAENPTGLDYFVKDLSFWGLSIIVLGIQFYILNLKGYDVMLMLGSFILICLSIYSIVRILKTDELSDYYKSMAIRFVCYLAVCLILQLTPKDQVYKFLHITDYQVEQEMGK